MKDIIALDGPASSNIYVDYTIKTAFGPKNDSSAFDLNIHACLHITI